MGSEEEWEGEERGGQGKVTDATQKTVSSRIVPSELFQLGFLGCVQARKLCSWEEEEGLLLPLHASTERCFCAWETVRVKCCAT